MMRPRRNPTSLKRHRKQSLITQHRVPHKSHEDLCPWSVTTTYHDYICAKDLEDKNNLLPRPTRTQPGLNNSTSCARSKWPSHSLLWWDQPQTGTTLGKHIELKCFLNEKNYGSESRGDQQDIPTPSSMDTKGRWQRRRSVPKLRSNFSRASSLNCATKPGRIYVMCTKGNTTRATSYMNIVLNFITKTNTPTLEYTHTLDITLTSSKIEKYGIGPSPIGKLSWNWNLKMFMHVPSIPGWLNAMDEGAGWSPFQWLRYVSDVPDGHLFTSTSSLHILRPVPRLLHFGPTGDVFERLRDGYICSTTWPSLLVALCHQIFSPAGVLGKFLTGTRNDDLNVCQQS